MNLLQSQNEREVGCISQMHLVLLAFFKSGLQHTLNGFAAACDIAGIKISTSKTEVLHISRNSVQCSLQVGKVPLKQVEKFKYLEIAFTSNGM